MKGLLLRDWYSLKSSIKPSYFAAALLFALMLTVPILAADSENMILGLSCCAVFCFALIALAVAMTTFSYDEKYACKDQILSSPVSGKMYVHSKYILTIILAFLGGLAGTAITAVLILIKGCAVSETLARLPIIFLATTAAVIILSAWMIPLYIRFKYSEATLLMLLLGTFLIGALFVIGINFSGGNMSSAAVRNIAVGFLTLSVLMYCMGYIWIKEKDQMFNKKKLRRASNINSVLLIMFFLLTFTVLLAEPMATLIVGKDSENFESLRYLIAFVLQYLIGIGVPLLLFRLSKDGKEMAAEKKPLFAKPKMSWGWIIKHFVIAYFFIYGTAFISNILVTLLQLALGIELNPATLQVSEGILSKIAVIVGAMILAPIFEEIFFRGVMLRNASRYGKWSAIIAMGIFFGLWHQNYPQTFFAIAMGIYSGFIAVKTGSIIPSVILHFIMNTMGTMMNIAVAGVDMEKLEAADMTYIMEHAGVFVAFSVYGFFIMGLIITGLVLFIIEMVKHRDSYRLDTVKEEGEPSEGRKLGIYFTAPITIIAVILYVGMTVLNAVVTV